MKCDRCGQEYTTYGTEDGFTVRNLCECEYTVKCSRCKRGKSVDPTQAVLDARKEVSSYRCTEHGYVEGEEFVRPTTPIGFKPVKKPEPPPSIVSRAPPITDPENRSGMVIEEQVWTTTKRAAIAAHKAETFKVTCTTCGDSHEARKRVLEFDDKAKVGVSLCAKCKGHGYRIN